MFVSFLLQPANASTGETRMSLEHDDNDTNESANPTFESVLTKRVSRREMFGNVAGAAALVAVGAAASEKALAQSGRDYGGNYGGGYGNPRRPLKLNFNPVAKSLEDAVTVPQGYSYDVLYALGDPIAAHVPDYRNDGTDDRGELRASRRRPSRRHALLRPGAERELQPAHIRARACCA